MTNKIRVLYLPFQQDENGIYAHYSSSLRWNIPFLISFEILPIMLVPKLLLGWISDYVYCEYILTTNSHWGYISAHFKKYIKINKII